MRINGGNDRTEMIRRYQVGPVPYQQNRYPIIVTKNRERQRKANKIAFNNQKIGDKGAIVVNRRRWQQCAKKERIGSVTKFLVKFGQNDVPRHSIIKDPQKTRSKSQERRKGETRWCQRQRIFPPSGVPLDVEFGIRGGSNLTINIPKKTGRSGWCQSVRQTRRGWNKTCFLEASLFRNSGYKNTHKQSHRGTKEPNRSLNFVPVFATAARFGDILYQSHQN